MGMQQELKGDENKRRQRHTCSLPSSFRASLTLPMLPAPMVLPSIHFPDWVGMTVRDLACLEVEGRGGASAWPCCWDWAAFWEPAPLLVVAEGAISG
jgi:hypothetical protein